ncbi:MAG: hypothetical protein GY823_09280 [Flavobacteriaceae bacterium]|nr:hypothetical protein [Flavobacteriaceae bacterium]
MQKNTKKLKNLIKFGKNYKVSTNYYSMIELINTFELYSADLKNLLQLINNNKIALKKFKILLNNSNFKKFEREIIYFLTNLSGSSIKTFVTHILSSPKLNIQVFLDLLSFKNYDIKQFLNLLSKNSHTKNRGTISPELINHLYNENQPKELGMELEFNKGIKKIYQIIKHPIAFQNFRDIINTISQITLISSYINNFSKLLLKDQNALEQFEALLKNKNINREMAYFLMELSSFGIESFKGFCTGLVFFDCCLKFTF